MDHTDFVSSNRTKRGKAGNRNRFELRDGIRIRQKELALICSKWEFALKSPLLEIGSGNGTQYRLLKEIVGDVVPSDIDDGSWPEELGGLNLLDAKALPFKNDTFVTVFSSCVLEHIPDVLVALSEMNRVLTSHGRMIHTVPTVAWKLLQLALYHVGMLRDWVATGHRGRIRPNLVHGVFPDSLDELFHLRDSVWRRLFDETGFEIEATINLPCYSPYRLMPPAIDFRRALGSLGFPSSRAYLIKKAIRCEPQ